MQKKMGTYKCKCLEALIKNGFKYSTIYADPPWPYTNQATRSATTGIEGKKREGSYPVMSMQELMAEPIETVSNSNCHIHLWTTNAFLHEAFHLLKSWGFTYKSCLVWKKSRMGIGNYWRVSHEYILLGVKGTKKHFNNHAMRSWIELPSGKHSEKPEQIREMVMKASDGPYLECYGRREVEGWTVYGNQIRKDLFSNAVLIE